MQKNFTIDCVDRLARAKNAGEVWQVSNEIAASIGTKALVTAEFHTGIEQLLWMQTSMSDAWMDEYVGADYASVDPLLKAIIEGAPSAEIVSGQLDPRDEAHSKLQIDLSHNLKTAGYNYLTTGRYLGKNHSVIRACTMIADDTASFGKPGSKRRQMMEFVRGLIASNLTGPGPGNTEGQIHIGVQTLSPRERECLGLLAEGNMTAGIAERLGIAEVTVNKHFSQAKKRLGAATREQAMAIAMAGGAISL